MDAVCQNGQENPGAGTIDSRVQHRHACRSRATRSTAKGVSAAGLYIRERNQDGLAPDGGRNETAARAGTEKSGRHRGLGTRRSRSGPRLGRGRPAADRAALTGSGGSEARVTRVRGGGVNGHPNRSAVPGTCKLLPARRVGIIVLGMESEGHRVSAALGVYRERGWSVLR